jgi:hypothetical protein
MKITTFGRFLRTNRFRGRTTNSRIFPALFALIFPIFSFVRFAIWIIRVLVVSFTRLTQPFVSLVQAFSISRPLPPLSLRSTFRASSEAWPFASRANVIVHLEVDRVFAFPTLFRRIPARAFPSRGR